MTTTKDFPIGGPRQAVYDALKSRQFKMDAFGDKSWTRLDGVTAHIYGTGSRLLVRNGEQEICDLPMAEALAVIDEQFAGVPDGMIRCYQCKQIVSIDCVEELNGRPDSPAVCFACLDESEDA